MKPITQLRLEVGDGDLFVGEVTRLAEQKGGPDLLAEIVPGLPTSASSWCCSTAARRRPSAASSCSSSAGSDELWPDFAIDDREIAAAVPIGTRFWREPERLAEAAPPTRMIAAALDKKRPTRSNR